jgi:hypothetical protein
MYASCVHSTLKHRKESMPLRFFRQLAMFVGVVGGTLVGYAAGMSCPQDVQLLFSFAGMAAGGGFVHHCLHGERQ